MPRTRSDLFWAKVEPFTDTESCWEWEGATSHGYGVFWDGARTVQAHRWAYEAVVGPIPEGLQIDHLCRNRACVNPDHLEPVTSGENTRRATRLITHCPRNHEYTPENTYTNPSGKRQCRTCSSACDRRRRARLAGGR